MGYQMGPKAKKKSKSVDALAKRNEQKIRSNITLRLPKDLLEEIDIICSENGISRTDYIENLIRHDLY